MPTVTVPRTAVSAPGKVLLAGGYLVLDKAYTGLVFGLTARINVISQAIQTIPGVQLSEIVVESPQFLHAKWTYGYHLADDDGGIRVTQLQVGGSISSNPFVETTLTYALTYVSRLNNQDPLQSIRPAAFTILADNDYYSQPRRDESIPTTDRPPLSPYSRFTTTLENAHKTGLGSSAALVTALTAAVLTHYLRPNVFNLTDKACKRTLHNLAQAAHCAAQGKVGSGFDVAAAVYGSCTYRRFSPSVLGRLPEAGSVGFGAALESVVAESGRGAGATRWDMKITKGSAILPKGVALRMCDVDCGSQTVGMVKKVNEWRNSHPEEAKELWDELQIRNERLAVGIKNGFLTSLGQLLGDVREYVRKMGTLSGVPIEPESQTELLDALSEVEGVYGGVVPGAGGFDAVALLIKDDLETDRRLEEFVAEWSRAKGTRVRLLPVRGTMEGIKREDVMAYPGWIKFGL